jgi:hypothetical protein
MHKVGDGYDLIIHDEHHRHGAFPKPGATVKLFKQLFGHLPHIYLSGTPTPESYSQIYHQFWCSKFSPFTEKTFYKWAANFVRVTQRQLPQGLVNDYSNADIAAIAPIIEPYMIRFTQAESGFTSTINEEIIWVEPEPRTVQLIETLKRDLVIVGREHTITADSAVALQQKIHQLSSGTILFDEVEGSPRHSMVLDTTKAQAIKNRFSGQKIVIFYKFKAELAALQTVLGDSITTELPEFNSTDKSIALQIVSGREGLNLSAATAIVFYNIDFSATSYWQARDRLTTITRNTSEVFWLFSKNGIESRIYDAVKRKKSYTSNMFKKDFGISNPKISHR